MDKENWIIKNEKLSTGVTYALKNSDSLYQSAKILLDNGRYAHALSIATLALEEFGKHCILKEHWMEGKDIDSVFWIKYIKKHEEKLKAIPKHLDQYTPKDADEKAKQELEKYKNYLVELGKRKLENLYVDWDKIEEKWLIVENSSSIKEKAEFSVSTAHWTIEKYIEELSWDRNLLFTPKDEIIVLFREGKVHAFCRICSLTLVTREDLLLHRKKFPEHD